MTRPDSLKQRLSGYSTSVYILRRLSIVFYNECTDYITSIYILVARYTRLQYNAARLFSLALLNCYTLSSTSLTEGTSRYVSNRSSLLSRIGSLYISIFLIL